MRKNSETPQRMDEWVDSVQRLSEESDAKTAKNVVADIYRAAQDELDAQRAQAEFEREE
ncbi:hypothetical protein HCJ76_14490 [Streptomyces sp. MC1]|uniref:hypothetical protein n=1 Tax=Streptomyces sp. MC1 TaxID=295105 RepID=UPI0018CB8156|nr:hypothetical protein [Streptomyces sp. MC1]MBG7699256.1 hypothetical protein [Streptomyces sp. MC1]